MIRSACRFHAAFSLLAFALAVNVANGSARAENVDVPAYRALQAAEPMAAPGSTGSDFSANAPSLSGLTLLATIPTPSSPRRGYLIQAQCTAGLIVVFDREAGGSNPTLIILAGAPVEWWTRRHAGYVRYAAHGKNRNLFERGRLSDGGEGMVMFPTRSSLFVFLSILATLASPLSGVAGVYAPSGGGGGGGGGASPGGSSGAIQTNNGAGGFGGITPGAGVCGVSRSADRRHPGDLAAIGRGGCQSRVYAAAEYADDHRHRDVGWAAVILPRTARSRWPRQRRTR